jgi:hypothetical protein
MGTRQGNSETMCAWTGRTCFDKTCRANRSGASIIMLNRKSVLKGVSSVSIKRKCMVSVFKDQRMSPQQLLHAA